MRERPFHSWMPLICSMIFHLSVAQVFRGSPSSWFWSWSCFTSVRELSPPGNGWWPRNIYDTGHSPRHSQPLLWKSKLFTPSIIYLSLDPYGFGTINGDVMVTVLVLKTTTRYILYCGSSGTWDTWVKIEHRESIAIAILPNILSRWGWWWEGEVNGVKTTFFSSTVCIFHI